jgi:anaerobic ribonucleoside-triphosphate reductase activating protein
VYSGREEVEDIFWNHFDYVKLGPFRAECGPLNNPATNQRLFALTAGRWEDITFRFWRKHV